MAKRNMKVDGHTGRGTMENGQLLHEIRLRLSFSCRALGQMAGLSGSMISRYERGYPIPDSSMEKLVVAKGDTIDVLLPWQGWLEGRVELAGNGLCTGMKRGRIIRWMTR